jgi:large subunit ribosomal protein L25
MVETNTLRAEARERAGKGAARSSRRAGRVPGVIYGDRQAPVLVTVDPRELTRVLHQPGFFAKLLTVDLDGQPHRTLPRDVQLDPVTDQPLHVDFMRIGAGAKLTVAIPVQFVNQEKAPGLRRGGILNVVRHEIDMVCDADHIPEHIVVDLDGLDIGDSVHVGAVALPQGAKPVIERNFTIASIAAPTAVRDEQAAAAASAATGAPAAEAAAPAAAAAPAKGGAAAAPKAAAPAKAAAKAPAAKAGGKS